MKVRMGRRVAVPLLGAMMAAGFGAVEPARAHAVVYPRVSEPGAYEKYVLRVPTERDLPTVSVELEFPPEVRVVSFAEVPGWQLEVTRDEEGRVTRARWTGTLPAARFIEFPFVAVNPSSSARLEWRAWQTYEDGERVGWTGPEGSATPASFTEIRAADGGGASAALVVSAVAAALSLTALGLALRYRSAAP